MLFKMEFKVVENRDNGIIVYYLKGDKRAVKKDIEALKEKSKRYEMFGKEGMIVWV